MDGTLNKPDWSGGSVKEKQSSGSTDTILNEPLPRTAESFPSQFTDDFLVVTFNKFISLGWEPSHFWCDQSFIPAFKAL